MKINFYTKINSFNKQLPTFKSNSVKISNLCRDNFPETFDFISNKLFSRGIKQAVFEEFDLYFKNPNPNNKFLIVKDKNDKILLTAGVFLKNKVDEYYPLFCAFKSRDWLAYYNQTSLLEKIKGFARQHQKKLYVPSWCNAMDEFSEEIYKTLGLKIIE